MQKLNGLEAAAIFQQMDQERDQGIPPHWNTYIHRRRRRLRRAGRPRTWAVQCSLAPSTCSKPAVWPLSRTPRERSSPHGSPSSTSGQGSSSRPGALTWNELQTSNPDAAIEFYVRLLGLERDETMEDLDYTLLKVQGTEVAGVVQIAPDWGPVTAQLAGLFRRRQR